MTHTDLLSLGGFTAPKFSEWGWVGEKRRGGGIKGTTAS